MDERERAVRMRLRDDFPHYARACLRIRPKDGGLVPFALNRVQREIHRRIEAHLARAGRVRTLILKARQPGCSTYVEGRFYWKVSHQRGVRAFILTHAQEATDNLFDMAERFHLNCPAAVKPHAGAANAKELYFDLLDSGYQVGTAGNRSVGRGSTIQFFHGSEVAYWPNAAEHMAGVMQAVPDRSGTEIILESTAKGMGGLFHDMVTAAARGGGGYGLVFVPWHWHEEYRTEPSQHRDGGGKDGWTPPAAFREYAELHGLDRGQLYWAWRKNAELAVSVRAPADEVCWKFRQEYPASAEEAFQAEGRESFIRSESVLRARRFVAPDQSHAPLVLGVDVARGGGDKTRLIDRQGRCLGHRVNLVIDSDDLMEVAGIVARTIERLSVDMTFIDATGLGAGVYDRLKELGFRRGIRAVNFGGAPADRRASLNKRAEMWAELRDWLDAPGGADIVDDDELHAELTAPGYRYDSNSRLVLEPKDDIKKRTGFSPDGADAAALTFAEPVRKEAAVRRRPAAVARDYRILE